MKGFFSTGETSSSNMPEGKILSCITCGLYKDCISARMKPYGNNKKNILVVGEAPGEWEDRKGKPWQGKTGRLLEQTLEKIGIDLFEDCISINAVSCRPMDKHGENRAPTNHEIDSCRRYVLRAIDTYKPKLIMLFGGSAVQSVIGYRWKKELGGITKWRGFTIPDRDLEAWICPTFHPSYVERGGKVEYTVWFGDLNRIKDLIGKPLPPHIEPNIEVIEDLDVLYSIKDECAIDYETTGIKPHGMGHRILSVAVADGPLHAFAFLMPEIRSKQKPLLDLLKNPDIRKIGQNIKFEESWSVNYLRQPVVNWSWDTMLATHIIDNRERITGLKFQVYVNFGVVDYESDVGPYKRAKDEKNANSINRMEELTKLPGGVDKLLYYNGYDATSTYRLAKIQQELIILPF